MKRRKKMIKAGLMTIVLLLVSVSIRAQAPEMVRVEGGTFNMGCTEEQGEECYRGAPHEVTVSDFYIGRYEVTVEEWKAFVQAAASAIPTAKKEYWNLAYEGESSYPMSNISWADAARYCNWLSEKAGLQAVYSLSGPADKIQVAIDHSANGYRLPTEAEWEYAARGGAKSQGYRYSGSNDLDQVAWYSKNAGKKVHPVGQKKPNELGLYDMSGNVAEWCQDYYHEAYYDFSPAQDPKGPQKKSKYEGRVQRGGDYYGKKHKYQARQCRVADRSYGMGDGYDLGIMTDGLRVVRTF